MIIYGAGMAGLLAANMLRRHSPVVREKQASLPDNHGALLRFRTDNVARETGQKFRRVTVRKALKLFGRGGLRDKVDIHSANMYSYKVGGEVMERSILNLDPGDRWIAPADFISTLAEEPVRIEYGLPLIALERGLESPIISTIPMPALMDLVKWPNIPDFNYRTIWSVRLVIPSPPIDVYQTIYYPDPTGEPYYRASITGRELIIEYAINPSPDGIMEHIWNVLADFGLAEFVEFSPEDVSITHQKYGKLMPIDATARRAFILAMTNEFNVYSVGRFATWRQLLLDDVVNDIKMVESFISDRDSYRRHLRSAH